MCKSPQLTNVSAVGCGRVSKLSSGTLLDYPLTPASKKCHPSEVEGLVSTRSGRHWLSEPNQDT
jgi:hypothetical protein